MLEMWWPAANGLIVHTHLASGWPPDFGNCRIAVEPGSGFSASTGAQLETHDVYGPRNLPSPSNPNHTPARSGEALSPQDTSTASLNGVRGSQAPRCALPCMTRQPVQPIEPSEYFARTPGLRQLNCNDSYRDPATSITRTDMEHTVGELGTLHHPNGAGGRSKTSSQSRAYGERSTPYPALRAGPRPLKPRSSLDATYDMNLAEIRADRGAIATTSAPCDGSHRNLTVDLYNWMFSVLYPKLRSDKTVPTPSGQCLLCDAFCKRPGILRQHVTIIHRQRMARKVIIGQRYWTELALAFVVAQLEVTSHKDAPILAEMDVFKKSLIVGLAPLSMNDFPMLSEKLVEFCAESSWVGVKCEWCGTWLTRPVALADHASLCAKRLEAPAETNVPIEQPLRLTAKGLAARPTRGINQSYRKCSPTLAATS